MTLTTVRKPEAQEARHSQPTVRRKAEPGPDPTRKPTPTTSFPRYMMGEGEALPSARATPAPQPTLPRYLAPEVSPQAPPAAAPTPTAIPAQQLGASVPLPSEAADRFSKAYGHDLSGVRVHPDNPVPGAHGARALATGSDIAFARGEYQPGTAAGQSVLGHELAHVVQQSRGKTGVQGKGLSEDSYEQEADTAASAALSGGEAPELSPLSEPSVQLQKAPASSAGAPGATPPAKPAPGKARKGEVDLSRGTLDPSSIEPDAQGKVMARLPGLAEGEIELEKSGDAYRTRGQGSAIALTLPALGTAFAESTVLIVRVANNAISGYVSLGTPGQRVSGNDAKLFKAIQKAPEALGWVGVSSVSIDKPQNALEGGQLTLGGGLGFTIGGYVKMRGSFTLQGGQTSLSGEGDVTIPGGSGGHLKADYIPEKGLSGETFLQVGLGKLSGRVDAKLQQGFLQVQGTVGYSDDRLKGTVTVMATDAATARQLIKTDPQAGQWPDAGGGGGKEGAAGAGPGASQKPGPRAFCGWGELDFSLTEWLTGKAKVVVNDRGEATVKGEIAPPKEIILFEQKDWTKSLAKVEVRAAYGLPVVGNVFVFANIGLEALATIGPGKLYNIKLSGQYSTDKSVDQELSLQASLNISAFAGLRLRAEGGAGIELLGHDIKAGVGLWALAGVRGYVEATPTIGYRKKAGASGEFYIKGHMELAAQPFLGLGGDLFVEVDSPWWSPLPDKKWTWPLGSLEYPLPGEFGLGADVEHVLGSKQWPEIQFSDVQFDSSKFMSDLLSENTPSKSKSGEDKKPAKWNEGGGGAPGGASGGPKGAAGGSKGKPGGAGGKPGKDKGGKDKGGKDKGGKDKGGKNKGGKNKGGKDKKSKDQEGAPEQIGEVIQFSARGKPYKLWVQTQGKSSKLMVESPPQGVPSWLHAQEEKVSALPKEEQRKARALLKEASAMGASIDRDAARIATAAGDKAALKKANAKIKKDERRLTATIRTLSEIGPSSGGHDHLGDPLPFSAAGESHRLWILVQGKRATIMVASAEQPVDTFLGLPAVVALEKTKEGKKTVQQARTLSQKVDLDAERILQHLSGSEPDPTKAEGADAKVAKEESQLLDLLRWIFEHLDDKGKLGAEKALHKARISEREKTVDRLLRAVVYDKEKSGHLAQNLYDQKRPLRLLKEDLDAADGREELELVKADIDKGLKDTDALLKNYGELLKDADKKREKIEGELDKNKQGWKDRELWEHAKQQVTAILAEYKSEILQAIPGASVKFRGSLASGWKGPHKVDKETGAAIRFNPKKFDCDAFIEVSNELWLRELVATGLVAPDKPWAKLDRILEWPRAASLKDVKAKIIEKLRGVDGYEREAGNPHFELTLQTEAESLQKLLQGNVYPTGALTKAGAGKIEEHLPEARTRDEKLPGKRMMDVNVEV